MSTPLSSISVNSVVLQCSRLQLWALVLFVLPLLVWLVMSSIKPGSLSLVLPAGAGSAFQS